MVEKRKHSTAFQVGPANLPDGTRKRKADRIKQALIDRAKIKQDFAKVKKRRLQEEQDQPKRNVYEDIETEEHNGPAEVAPAEPHPDRQALMDGPEETIEEPQDRSHKRGQGRRHKQDPFTKQVSHAQKQKAEADQRRQERDEADRQRKRKIEEREKMQRLIRKAKRQTVDGKRKLGRESEFLLEKVKRMVNG